VYRWFCRKKCIHIISDFKAIGLGNVCNYNNTIQKVLFDVSMARKHMDTSTLVEENDRSPRNVGKPAFTPPRKFSWYTFLTKLESTLRPQCGWKD